MSDYKVGINVKKCVSQYKHKYGGRTRTIRGRLDLHLLMYTRNLLAEWIRQTSLPYHRMYFRLVVGFILSNRNANLNCNCFWSVRMYRHYRAGIVQLVVSKIMGPTTKKSWFDCRDGARHFSVSQSVQSRCGTQSAPYSTGTGGSSHGDKATEAWS